MPEPEPPSRAEVHEEVDEPLPEPVNDDPEDAIEGTEMPGRATEREFQKDAPMRTGEERLRILREWERAKGEDEEVGILMKYGITRMHIGSWKGLHARREREVEGAGFGLGPPRVLELLPRNPSVPKVERVTQQPWQCGCDSHAGRAAPPRDPHADLQLVYVVQSGSRLNGVERVEERLHRAVSEPWGPGHGVLFEQDPVLLARPVDDSQEKRRRFPVFPFDRASRV